MPDYFLAEHLAAKLGLSARELEEFEARGVIGRVEKKGRNYYSAQDAYRLRALLHLMHARGLSFQEARARVGGQPRVASAGGC